jgi:hypothetical protein
LIEKYYKILYESIETNTVDSNFINDFLYNKHDKFACLYNAVQDKLTPEGNKIMEELFETRSHYSLLYYYMRKIKIGGTNVNAISIRLKGKNTFSKCLILDTMILMRKLFPIEHQ